MVEDVRDRVKNSWLYIPMNVIVWVLVWVSIDVLLSGGSVISAAIPGAAGGLAFGIFTYYLKSRDST
jgi:exosome complex RNA-binding protein Rrp42 (RNase PH superfamily)